MKVNWSCYGWGKEVYFGRLRIVLLKKKASWGLRCYKNKLLY